MNPDCGLPLVHFVMLSFPSLEALAITCHHLSPYAHKSVHFVLHSASQ